jgi:Phosphotransferase enzyme family
MNNVGNDQPRLPLCVEEVTPEWLSECLSIWSPETRVLAIEDMQVILGSATKLRLRLRFDGDYPDGPPETLCLKAGFDAHHRSLAGSAFCLEADFYAQIGRNIDIPLPRCWFAAADPQHGQGIVILDDLIATGGRFGDIMEPWSPDEVLAGLEVLANLHGRTWGAKNSMYPWLPEYCPLHPLVVTLYEDDNWRRTLAEPFADLIPASLRDPRRLSQAQSKMWASDDSAVRCMVHMDPHLGNAYFDRKGQPTFIDWQCVTLSHSIDDVAYFLSGAMVVEDRRKHESDLLRSYLDALHRFGGPALDFNAAWLDYRKQLIHGFIWALTPSSMQSTARVAAMSERHIAAIVDHDTLRLIEQS